MSKISIEKIISNNIVYANDSKIEIEKIKCTCHCHKEGVNIKHIKPCCKNGFINKVTIKKK